MTPQEFIRKWKPAALTERASAQEQFIDLCRVFGHPTPVEDDPTGEPHPAEERRSGGEAQRAHTDEPLQPAAALARRRP
jgi:hypothetical protein